MQDAITVLSIVDVTISRTIEDEQSTARAGTRKICRVIGEWAYYAYLEIPLGL
jgi:hypothetical protein